MTAGVIDVSSQQTCPEDVRKVVNRAAKRLRGSTRCCPDLVLTEEEDAFRHMLGARLIRAFHCTRLLDHEVEAIRHDGLRPLTRELITDRVEAAYRSGALSQTEHDHLLEKHVFAVGNPMGREDQVCLVLPERMLDGDGVLPLLETWGGEAIYWSHSGTEFKRTRLQSIGRPSVVVASLDFSVPGEHFVCADLLHCFVGKVLNLSDVGADVFFKAPVPAKYIEAIWQPGDPRYDRHANLPRG